MKAYFLSDMHLGAPYFPDSKEAEKRLVSFLDSIKHDADVIYLLGDVLDYWYEYRYVVPKGFIRFFGKLAELTDMGVRVVWLIGNHDIWISDYIPSELGVEVYDGAITETIDGYEFYMTHGDGIGKLKPSFRFLRGMFRNKFCQWLYSSIHPRWTVPFAYNWSRHSRKRGMADSDTKYEDMITHNYVDFAESYLKNHPNISYFMLGHVHLLKRIKLNGSQTTSERQDVSEKQDTPEIIILGEWLSLFSYAYWDGTRLSIHRYKEK